MNLARNLVLLSSFLALASCASRREPTMSAEFAAHRPASISVLPPIQRSYDEGAPAIVQRLVEEELGERGYRVGSGSDATLHVAIEASKRQAELSQGRSNRSMWLTARLYDRTTGTLIWSGSGVCEEENEDEDEGNWLAAIVDDLVQRGAEALFRSQEDVAAEAVSDLLDNLPRGREDG
jgi:hypothetical protein